MNGQSHLSRGIQVEDFNSRHSSLFSGLDNLKNQTAIPTLDRSKGRHLGFELVASITPEDSSK